MPDLTSPLPLLSAAGAEIGALCAPPFAGGPSGPLPALRGGVVFAAYHARTAGPGDCAPHAAANPGALHGPSCL